MHSLVTTNELIGEHETRHKTALLQPEDGGKRSRKEYSFDCCESNQPLGKHRTLIGNPSESPVGLALDAGNGVHGVEEVLGLHGVQDVSIDEERVSLGMDILHYNLEAIEAASLDSSDLIREPFDQILIDNPVRSSDESEYMGDKVPLVVIQMVVPVVDVL